ncbi:hypothetical protein KP509_01G017100 [Ceratopteris richardii]|uniref:Legume lectin domain-containing protein n=1 Tax=Ceratopteris richardii TaxID=49495 RepID=A0A8T2VET0_CERRI|nr:hypothetical protein KP509_01G017100 [Ceratopteris richardii]
MHTEPAMARQSSLIPFLISCPVRRILLLALTTALLGCYIQAAAGIAAPLKGVSLSFPPFTSSLKCVPAAGSQPSQICHAVTGQNGPQILLYSETQSVISTRYQYNSKVQLWKKGSPYAASFSSAFTVLASPVDDQTFTFGCIAFAITPDLRVGEAGPESFGLFEVVEKTGNSLRGNATKTIAVEIDMSRNFASDSNAFDDPPIPHLGLDINSVKSVVNKSLGSLESFTDRRIAVFIDYDAAKQLLEVRVQKLPKNDETTKPEKKKAKRYFSHRLRLSDYVNEKSYVGFGSRVPIGDDGVYILYDWTFSTTWVPTK